MNSGSGKYFQLYNAGITTKAGSELTSVTLTPNRIYTLTSEAEWLQVMHTPTLPIITTRQS